MGVSRRIQKTRLRHRHLLPGGGCAAPVTHSRRRLRRFVAPPQRTPLPRVGCALLTFDSDPPFDCQPLMCKWNISSSTRCTGGSALSYEELEPLMPSAADEDTKEQLFASLYGELRRLAQRELRRNNFVIT